MFGAGTDAVVEAGDIVLVWRDPTDVPRAFSRRGASCSSQLWGPVQMSLSTRDRGGQRNRSAARGSREDASAARYDSRGGRRRPCELSDLSASVVRLK